MDISFHSCVCLRPQTSTHLCTNLSVRLGVYRHSACSHTLSPTSPPPPDQNYPSLGKCREQWQPHSYTGAGRGVVGKDCRWSQFEQPPLLHPWSPGPEWRELLAKSQAHSLSRVVPSLGKRQGAAPAATSSAATLSKGREQQAARPSPIQQGPQAGKQARSKQQQSGRRVEQPFKLPSISQSGKQADSFALLLLSLPGADHKGSIQEHYIWKVFLQEGAFPKEKLTELPVSTSFTTEPRAPNRNWKQYQEMITLTPLSSFPCFFLPLQLSVFLSHPAAYSRTAPTALVSGTLLFYVCSLGRRGLSHCSIDLN